MSKIIQNLADIKVITRLEIGPTKVEPSRIITPYRVVKDDGEDLIELIYRYEEPVFDSQNPGDQNLANMIGAQVALNYGFFCDSIVFRGRYDDSDQEFLQGMAENTAREIYVKKFLEPNPFLIGEASNLAVIRQENYLQAKLIFPDSHSKEETVWNTDVERFSILSSGGKDSLLSFGLIRDLGKEVHPIFGNESGRHWFTALNAHRFFKENIPNTSRVWMNSDRVFAWMLRHFPFIRRDFANIRSDEYPIRLWTVAVFLFGALPLLRKRNIGNLVIGDEYDSTDLTTFNGIPHYNGLYDQSRYFDEALTLYFRQKNWNIRQFSLLRTLSEMLIEKILVKRYPELQAHQVSCHAAHKENNRVHPCGKCEKCRRIVGMLMAIDADPGRCGYSPVQIENCLKELARRGVHQEYEGAQQLTWMLWKKGLIDLPKDISPTLTPHPEILKLRFHSEKSPPDEIPHTIRNQIYRIFLQYADGALQFNRNNWIEFDPLKKE